MISADAYYDRPAGSVCDDESHVIRSEEECTDALKELYYPTTVSYWTGQASSIPSGCSIRDGGDNVPHLETSSSGKGNGRKDLIPICKDPSAESSVSECQCDVRGTQLNVNYGDWCYIKDSPCKSLTGEVMSGTWVRCHDQGDPSAQELIKCPIMAHSGPCNPSFVDHEGKDCQTYVDSDWCTSNGEYGNEWGNWVFDENAVYLWDKEWNDWGTFELYSDNGQSASLCPQCGCSPVTDLGVKKIKLGTLCSSTGLEEIKSENECKAAAEKLDLVWEVSYNGPNEFPACFHAEDGKNKVYFNTSPNPSRSTNLLRKKEAAAICQGPTNKGPMCECDDRGTQLDYDDGNWCYLKEAPCELHTGDVVGDNGDNGDPWARCQVNGDFQVECPTNMPEGDACNEGECWCVSRGKETCVNQDFVDYGWFKTYNFGSTACSMDKCHPSENCEHTDAGVTRGYWCDDSLLKDNDVPELVDCAKFLGVKRKVILENFRSGGDHAYDTIEDPDLKTVINCLQSQLKKVLDFSISKLD